MFRARAFRVKRTLCNFLYSVGNVALPVAGKIDALAALHCQRRYAAHLIAIRDAAVKLGVLQGTATIASKVSAIDTLRARIGYAQDNWLFYGTVGVALTNDTSTFTQTAGFACNNGVVPCSSKADWHAGLAAGAGIEYGVTPNLSTKIEYLWVGAGAVNILKENMVRAGLNWRFGG
jgi:opacity protein-like surface antigen